MKNECLLVKDTLTNKCGSGKLKNVTKTFFNINNYIYIYCAVNIGVLQTLSHVLLKATKTVSDKTNLTSASNRKHKKEGSLNKLCSITKAGSEI